MVAVHTSDPDLLPDPPREMSRLRVVEAPPSQLGWSPTHPAVRSARGQLHPVHGGGQRSVQSARPRRRHRLVYLRRRLVAALLLLVLMWAVVSVVEGLTRGGSVEAGASEHLSSHVVDAGETWWSLAGNLDRPGDIRDTVDRLIQLNGSAELQAGQRVVLPVG